MKLEEKLSRVKFGNLGAISNVNCDYLTQMIEVMNDQSNMSPSQFYHVWVKSKEFEAVEKSLLNDYPLEIVYGNKPMQLLPSSFMSFKITDFLQKGLGKNISFKQHKLLNYDEQLYQLLAGVSVAMLLNKYKPESLYKEHIIFICIKVMLTYFTLYNKNGFLVCLNQISVCAYKILNTELHKFDELSRKLGFKYTQIKRVDIKKTLTLAQIEAFIEPGDTQTMIKEKIMKWCPCGERKARKIMRMYGLTNQKYTRKNQRIPPKKDNIT
jgi:hypothetical protein